MRIDTHGPRATLSPKFQVAIPKEIRERIKLRSGTKFQVIAYENRIELIPIRSIKELKGFASLKDSDIPRGDDRE